MNEILCRLLPFEHAAGQENMAADEALLASAAAGIASLRFYGWTQPTVSLGYFQPAAIRRVDPLLRHLPCVRRPSGGATLVHHHELTYALALPPGPPWQTGESWLARMHQLIRGALLLLGVSEAEQPVADVKPYLGDLCFNHWAAGDLIVRGAKIAGSAQRKQRGALLQHGAILLQQSPHTPSLPGLRELMGREFVGDAVRLAIQDAFAQATGWRLIDDEWSDQERARRAELAATRYGSPKWNDRR